MITKTIAGYKILPIGKKQSETETTILRKPLLSGMQLFSGRSERVKAASQSVAEGATRVRDAERWSCRVCMDLMLKNKEVWICKEVQVALLCVKIIKTQYVCMQRHHLARSQPPYFDVVIDYMHKRTC